jgi:NADH:ubiquinone oxidoreductase subunit 6 (subunit J)
VFVGVVGFLVQAPPSAPRPAWPGDLTVAVGQALVGAYAVPLELLGVLLVIALLGALYFARSEG